MSQISRKLLGSLTQDYLWIRTLTNQPESKLTEKLTAATKEFQAAANKPASSSLTSGGDASAPARGGRGGGGGGARGGDAGSDNNPLARSTSSSSNSSSSNFRMNAHTQEWNKAVNHLNDIAEEQLTETTLLGTKKHIFS